MDWTDKFCPLEFFRNFYSPHLSYSLTYVKVIYITVKNVESTIIPPIFIYMWDVIDRCRNEVRDKAWFSCPAILENGQNGGFSTVDHSKMIYGTWNFVDRFLFVFRITTTIIV